MQKLSSNILVNTHFQLIFLQIIVESLQEQNDLNSEEHICIFLELRIIDKIYKN